MMRRILICLCLCLLMTANVQGQENASRGKGEVKTLSGMSIVGNDEAPKALYIVPWKSSKVGTETVLNMPASGELTAVDREEFRRKLDYYTISKTGKTGR